MLLVLVTDMSQSVRLVLLVCNATGVGDKHVSVCMASLVGVSCCWCW